MPPDSTVKMLKTIFVSGVMSSNSSARFEKHRGPVMIVKPGKQKKIFKNFENIKTLIKSCQNSRHSNVQNQFIVVRHYPVSQIQVLYTFTALTKVHKLGT